MVSRERKCSNLIKEQSHWVAFSLQQWEYDFEPKFLNKLLLTDWCDLFNTDI